MSYDKTKSSRFEREDKFALSRKTCVTIWHSAVVDLQKDIKTYVEIFASAAVVFSVI